MIFATWGCWGGLLGVRGGSPRACPRVYYTQQSMLCKTWACAATFGSTHRIARQERSMEQGDGAGTPQLYERLMQEAGQILDPPTAQHAVAQFLAQYRVPNTPQMLAGDDALLMEGQAFLPRICVSSVPRRNRRRSANGLRRRWRAIRRPMPS